jgi:branched-chain amino acid transport system ATP-binding protein
MKTISGLLRAQQGEIAFAGTDITRRRPDQIAGQGLVHCPEGRAVLGRMTVRDNLDMGAYRRGRDPAIAADLDEVFGMFPRLHERRFQLASTLSGGEQQMLALGRAFMARPAMVAIDEPSLGLAPLVVAEVFRVIRQLRQRGVTILLVEQNAMQALRCADRAYVLEMGRVTISGVARELLEDAGIRRAYLGSMLAPGVSPV